MNALHQLECTLHQLALTSFLKIEGQFFLVPALFFELLKMTLPLPQPRWEQDTHRISDTFLS